MKRHLWLLLAVLALLLMSAVPAGAKKPDNPGRPGPSAPEPGWTCEARNDNGAIWVLGEPHGDGYIANALPSCIDIEDTSPRAWTVTWEGESVRPIKGLRLVFEQGVHGEIYADTEVFTTSGMWTTPLIDPADDVPFVLVAMARSGDKWLGFTITVAPATVAQAFS